MKHILTLISVLLISNIVYAVDARVDGYSMLLELDKVQRKDVEQRELILRLLQQDSVVIRNEVYMNMYRTVIDASYTDFSGDKMGEELRRELEAERNEAADDFMSGLSHIVGELWAAGVEVSPTDLSQLRSLVANFVLGKSLIGDGLSANLKQQVGMGVKEAIDSRIVYGVDNIDHNFRDFIWRSEHNPLRYAQNLVGEGAMLRSENSEVFHSRWTSAFGGREGPMDTDVMDVVCKHAMTSMQHDASLRLIRTYANLPNILAEYARHKGYKEVKSFVDHVQLQKDSSRIWADIMIEAFDKPHLFNNYWSKQGNGSWREASDHFRGANNIDRLFFDNSIRPYIQSSGYLGGGDGLLNGIAADYYELLTLINRIKSHWSDNPANREAYKREADFFEAVGVKLLVASC